MAINFLISFPLLSARGSTAHLLNSMYDKDEKSRAKKPTKCSCLNGWVCEDHPNQPWGHRGCQAAGELCTNPQCNKDPDSIFLSVDCQLQPGRTKPPVRKTMLSSRSHSSYPLRRNTPNYKYGDKSGLKERGETKG
jgi:hypothetical protein